MRGIGNVDPGWGVTAVRIALGVIFLLAGYGKFADGLGGLAEAFASMGVPMPQVAAPFVAMLELVGGALLLIGLAGRWLGLLFAIQFAYITFLLKLPADGWEGARLDVTILAGSLLLFLAGSGRASVDEVWLERDQGPGTGRRAR